MEINNFYNRQNNHQEKKSSNILFFQNFYPYHSKPRIVPIAKKAAGFFAIASSIFFVFANIMGYLVVNSPVISKIYIDTFWTGVMLLYFLVMFLIAYQTIKKQHQKQKKYIISYWYPLLSSLYIGFWIWRTIDVWTWLIKQNIVHSFFGVWKVLIIIHIVCLILIVVVFIVAFLSNPKIDYDRIRKFQQEMINLQKAKSEGKEYIVNIEGLD